jgi:hypothetical protein
LLQSLIAVRSGARQNLLDVRSQAPLAPIISRRFFGVAGVTGPRAFQQRLGGRGVVARIISRW